MYYQLTGISGNLHTYAVTLKLYQRCQSGRSFPSPAFISAFDRLGGARIQDYSISISRTEVLGITNPDPCISNPPEVCFEIAYYEFSVTLPANANGYVLASMVNFRINNITNLSNASGRLGALYTAEIPGTAGAANGPANHSAQFIGSDLVIVCADNPFAYSFAATDADNDELRYSFCAAFNSTNANGGGGGGFGNPPIPPANPPFPQVPYNTGFDGTLPLGNTVQISSNSGLITGIAPAVGTYVVTVCVEEWRNNALIATQRKDVQINVANCGITAAQLPESFQLCDTSFTLSTANLSLSSDIKSYKWLVQNRNKQTLLQYNTPTLLHTFADTGLYFIKLIINEGDACTDSALAPVYVYPGFAADFSFVGLCAGRGTSFTDKTTSRYGVANSWQWDFGESLESNDTSRQKNPTYVYPSAGQKIVQLLVSNTVGCKDTVLYTLPISLNPPLLLSFKDTLICRGDTIPLFAGGSGNIVWTPTQNISAAVGNNILAFPGTTTRYYATLNDNGCTNRDSLDVRVVNAVTLQLMADTTICSGDAIVLRCVSDGLRFSWTPAALLNDPTLQNPMAMVTAQTSFSVTATIGGCTNRASVAVNPVPYPVAHAGADTLICFNTSALLSGRGNGIRAQWSPATQITNPFGFGTVARPTATTMYTLRVFDNKGCPKPGIDSVLVTVLPPIRAFAGHDTSVMVAQPLQLNASGGVRVVWTPASFLNNPSIYNPIAVFNQLSEGIRFQLVAYNEAGCSDTAYLRVKVFGKSNFVYMPTGFTPNADGLNDVLRPTLAGVQRLEDFSIYNRYGQLVFRTQTPGKGWDGKMNAIAQMPGTYVWMVSVVTYDNQRLTTKGTTTLVR